ncbi:MAG: hypothetical protein ACOC5D_01430 [Thermoplasmatota archaeon]
MCKSLRQEDIDGKIPDSVEPTVIKASIQSRKPPSVHNDHKKEEVKVQTGLIKILKAEPDSDLERGMKFVIKHKKIIADKIKIDKKKVRGSNNHNKYRFVAFSAKIINYNDFKLQNGR